MSAAHHTSHVRTMAQIVADVARLYDLSEHDLRTTRRTIGPARARHRAFADMLDDSYTYQAVADFFGLDYSTVYLGVRGHRTRMGAATRRAELIKSVVEKSPPIPPLLGRPKLALSPAVDKYAPAFDALFAQAFADGGFGALHKLIEEARTRLATRKRAEIAAEGWIA